MIVALVPLPSRQPVLSSHLGCCAKISERSHLKTLAVAEVLPFLTVARSLVPSKNQVLCHQRNTRSFAKTPGGVPLVAMVRAPISASPLFALPIPYWAVSRSRTASDSTCPRSIASLLPSGENRYRDTCSELKCVSCRGGELSSGCSQRLSTPFSRTTYTTAFGSGANARGGEARWSNS
jgi:hypothetical protein